MTFKELYASIKDHLVKASNGELVTFTHRGFHGKEFEIRLVGCPHCMNAVRSDDTTCCSCGEEIKK